MELNAVLKSLRNIDDSKDTLKVDSRRSYCSIWDVSTRLIDCASRKNELGKIYRLYEETLRIGQRTFLIPYDDTEYINAEGTTCFYVLCKDIKSVVKKVERELTAKLAVADIHEVQLCSSDDLVYYHLYLSSNGAYRVYYIPTENVSYDLKSDVAEIEYAAIMHRLINNRIEDYKEELNRLKYLITKDLRKYRIGNYSYLCFGIRVNSYLSLLKKIIKEVLNGSSILNTLSKEDRICVINNIIEVTASIWSSNCYSSLDDNLKVINALAVNKCMVCGESALAYNGLTKNKCCPVTLCTDMYSDEIACDVYNIVNKSIGNSFRYCKVLGDACNNLYMPNKERAILEYAMYAKDPMPVLSEALVTYLKQVDSLDALYEIAKYFNISARFIDVMICSALMYTEICDLVELV